MCADTGDFCESIPTHIDCNIIKINLVLYIFSIKINLLDSNSLLTQLEDVSSM